MLGRTVEQWPSKACKQRRARGGACFEILRLGNFIIPGSFEQLLDNLELPGSLAVVSEAEAASLLAGAFRHGAPVLYHHFEPGVPMVQMRTVAAARARSCCRIRQRRAGRSTMPRCRGG